MKSTELKEKLMCSEVSFYKGIFIARKGFFYRLGQSQKIFKEDIENKLKNLKLDYEIVDSGEVYKAFRGGSELKNSSHWFVKFIIK